MICNSITSKQETLQITSSHRQGQSHQMWTQLWLQGILAITRRTAIASSTISILASRNQLLFSNSSYILINRPSRAKIASHKLMCRVPSTPTIAWCRPWMTKSTASSLSHTHKCRLRLEPLGWSPWTRYPLPKWTLTPCPATTRSMWHKITHLTTMDRRVVKDSRSINRYTCFQSRQR